MHADLQSSIESVFFCVQVEIDQPVIVKWKTLAKMGIAGGGIAEEGGFDLGEGLDAQSAGDVEFRVVAAGGADEAMEQYKDSQVYPAMAQDDGCLNGGPAALVNDV